MFLNVNVLPEVKYWCFGLGQETNNVQCMDLVFKNMKISGKTDQKLSQRQKQSTNDV